MAKAGDPRRCPFCLPNLVAMQRTAIEMDDPMVIALGVQMPCQHTRREKRNESRRLREQRTLPLNTWFHYCETRDSTGTKTSYINGQVVADDGDKKS